ncbi:peptidylprolyl isomerase [Macrococcus capreoli]|uniref:peptidylprolyl isomerase n=1 Tax=Macrococcus capreoli TaxID=2982690 RepID=UPI003EE4ED8B
MKKINTKRVIVLITCTLMLGACNGKSTDGEIIATSKAGEITTHDYFKSMNQDMLSNTMLEVAINKILTQKYSEKIDKKAIDKSFEDVIKQYGGEAKFKELIKKQSPNMTIEEYKEKRYLDAYKEKFITDSIKVTDEEIKNETRNISQIIYPLNNIKKDDLKSAEDQMEKIRLEVSKDSKKFDKVQDKNSKQPKYFVNSLRMATKNDIIASAQKEVFKMKKGEVSKVFKDDNALYIFKVNEEAPKAADLKDLKLKIVRDKISHNPKVLQDAYKTILKEYDVKFSDQEVSKAIEKQLSKEAVSKNE